MLLINYQRFICDFDINIIIISFPKDETLKKIWLDVCGISSLQDATKICSDHFPDDAFESFDKKRLRLKADAVPLPNFTAQRVAPSVSPVEATLPAASKPMGVESTDAILSAVADSESEHQLSRHRPMRKILGLQRKNFADGESWKKFAAVAKQLRDKIKCQKRQIVRAKATHEKMRKIITALKTKNQSSSSILNDTRTNCKKNKEKSAIATKV